MGLAARIISHTQLPEKAVKAAKEKLKNWNQPRRIPGGSSADIVQENPQVNKKRTNRVTREISTQGQPSISEISKNGINPYTIKGKVSTKRHKLAMWRFVWTSLRSIIKWLDPSSKLQLNLGDEHNRLNLKDKVRGSRCLPGASGVEICGATRSLHRKVLCNVSHNRGVFVSICYLTVWTHRYQIKSNHFLLSHHHSTSALVSEILMSVLQTVQKKNNRQFTYGQTVQKKQQTIYIWTDSAKKTTNNLHMDRQCKKNNSNLHMDSTYLQTVQKTMCKIHIHILSTHSVL